MTHSGFRVQDGYAPRPTAFAGVREHRGWRLKMYEIVNAPAPGQAPLDRAEFERGMRLALNVLPTPAIDAHRPGLGVVILHQGLSMLYLVVAWWGNENEMPIRVFVREIGADASSAWRPAAGDESVCVWDLDVITHERNAYIKHVLSRPDAPDIESYLSDGL